jgi:drug/metabolite transporter (DMT)-like permease
MWYLITIVILAFAASRGAQRVLTSISLETLDGWTITAFSLLLSCLVWLPIAWHRKWIIRNKDLWIKSIPLSVVNIVIPALAFTFAQLFVTAGVAALFVSFLPVTVALLAWAFIKQKPSTKVSVGVGIATIGVIMLSIGRNGALDVDNWWAGVALLALGILSAAAVYVGWRKLLSEYQAVELLSPQLVISSLVVIPVAFIFGNLSSLTVEIIPLLLFLGIVNYIIPQLAMFWLLTRTTSVRAALANYLAPVFAIMLGAIFLGEAITFIIIASGALIILGASFVNSSKPQE